MDFVTVREFHTQPAKVWKKLKAGKDIVVTRNGKPFALLTHTEADRVEENLRAIRAARFATALRETQRIAKQKGLDRMTIKEINAEIAAVRKAREKRSADVRLPSSTTHAEQIAALAGCLASPSQRKLSTQVQRAAIIKRVGERYRQTKPGRTKR